MSHELDFVDGQAAMMYVRDVPWHGLGTQLKKPPSASEAIAAARLDWKVGLKRVYCMENGVYYEIPDRKAVARLDRWGQPDFQPFGLVGKDYRILQNAEAFEFFDALIDSGKATYETAGALGKGEKVWVLARIKDDILVKGKDQIEKYLLLSNGHDGRTAMDIRFTPVRVVCKNTLVFSMQRGWNVGKIYHVKGMDKKVAETKALVENILRQYEELADDYEKLASIKVDDPLLRDYLVGVFPNPRRNRYKSDAAYETACETVEATRRVAERLFTKGTGNDIPEVQGTLWAAYNGVTEYVDHHVDKPDPWMRMRFTCYGEGCLIKERAFTRALKIAESN